MSLIRNTSKFVLPLMGACLAANVSAADLGKVGDTAVSIKGFVKFDAIYSDFDSGALAAGSTGRDFYLPGLTPVGDGEGSTSLDMHARQSRVVLQTDTDLGSNKLKTYIEFDSFGGGGTERATNFFGLGMRHAFLTYDKWLFGQTWTTFMDTSVLPDTLDFIGNTDATPFVRQAQVRYTSGAFQFALENPATTVWGSANAEEDSNILPDVVAKYSMGSGDLKMSFAGIFRQLKMVSGGDDLTTTGFGLGISGTYVFGDDNVKFLATYGSGIGRYFGLAGPYAADAILTADNELEAIDTLSYYAAWMHKWSPDWRSTFSYSAMDVEDTDSNSDAWTTNSYSFRANLLTNPVPNLTLGGEVTLAEREVQSGATGALTRLQFSAKLAF